MENMIPGGSVSDPPAEAPRMTLVQSMGQEATCSSREHISSPHTGVAVGFTVESCGK